jgi:RNA polymerase sigma-70 factor (ECF subfamily)
LFTILRNCHYSDLRHRKFEVEDPESLLAASRSIDVDYTVQVQLQELNDALQRLPESQRDALMLVHVAGLPYEQAAQTCGVAIGTIKSRIARARVSLQAWLGSPLAC